MEVDTEASEVYLWGKDPVDALGHTADCLAFALRACREDNRKVIFVAFQWAFCSYFSCVLGARTSVPKRKVVHGMSVVQQAVG